MTHTVTMMVIRITLTAEKQVRERKNNESWKLLNFVK